MVRMMFDKTCGTASLQKPCLKLFGGTPITTELHMCPAQAMFLTQTSAPNSAGIGAVKRDYEAMKDNKSTENKQQDLKLLSCLHGLTSLKVRIN